MEKGKQIYDIIIITITLNTTWRRIFRVHKVPKHCAMLVVFGGPSSSVRQTTLIIMAVAEISRPWLKRNSDPHRYDEIWPGAFLDSEPLYTGSFATEQFLDSSDFVKFIAVPYRAFRHVQSMVYHTRVVDIPLLLLPYVKLLSDQSNISFYLCDGRRMPYPCKVDTRFWA